MDEQPRPRARIPSWGKLSRPKKLFVILIIACVLSFAYHCSRRCWKAGAWQIRIATGSEGGTFYPLGCQLAQSLEEIPGKPIQVATAQATRGSVENLERLLAGDCNVGFAVGPAVAQATKENPELVDEVAVLARLYRDMVYVVVRGKPDGSGEDADHSDGTSESDDTDPDTKKEAPGGNRGRPYIESLDDLMGKTICIGSGKSGTRLVAEWVLKAAGIHPNYNVPRSDEGFGGAIDLLEDGRIDAAFIVAGIPADAVMKALKSRNCKLLEVGELSLEPAPGGYSGLVQGEIPADTYENQPKCVLTIGADTFLLARKDLSSSAACLIEDTLFDNLEDLLLAHTKAHDIRFNRAFLSLPRGMELHPGAVEFLKKEQERLLIATGALNGKYHNLGRTIQMVLEARGIPSRVIHTDGSIENARLLLDSRPTIALMQYDMALASRFSKSRPVYKLDLPDMPDGSGIRRIAALHEEKVHIIMRRDALPEDEQRLGTIRDLEGRSVCLGPRHSGTQTLARALLLEHQVRPEPAVFLSVDRMVNKLHAKEIDAGFMVSFVPSEAVKTLLNSANMRLLSVELDRMASMVGGPAINTARIDGAYACQLAGEPLVQTVATRALLVTSRGLPDDLVHTITEAVFEEDAFLHLKGGKEALARDLSSIPLHPGAKAYYEEAGYLPSRSNEIYAACTFVLNNIWRILAILVIVLGGFKGGLGLRRAVTASWFTRRIFQVRITADDPDSVSELLAIQSEIRERVRRRWWNWGEIDKERWKVLHDLIGTRMKDATEYLTMGLLEKIRSANGISDDDERRRACAALNAQIWKGLEAGELEDSQYKFLMEVLHDRSRQPPADEAEA